MLDKTILHMSESGITIPEPNSPAANYVPYKLSGNILYISGQTAKLNGKLKYTGKATDSSSTKDAYNAARLCGLNIISQLNNALEGKLDNVSSCVRLNVYVNSTNNYNEYAKAANGASDLMVEIFGEKGKHTRVAVGSSNLPSDSLVEVDAIFEVNNERL